MKVLVLILAFVAAANALSFFDVIKEEWHAFKVRTHNFFMTGLMNLMRFLGIIY